MKKSACFLNILAVAVLVFWGVANPGFSQAKTDETCSSWQAQFESILDRLTDKYKNGKDISKDELYRLGRLFIRNELERKSPKIEEDKLETATIVLKAVYAFADFTNPLGRELGDDVPGFDPDLPDSETLRERWEALYESALENDVVIYSYGGQLHGYQIYELGRAMFLKYYHSASSPFGYVNGDEWIVLRSALYIVCYLNVPGGFNPSYAPGFTAKVKQLKSRDSKWSRVETYLRNYAGVMGYSDGIVNFLAGEPRSWAALEKRLPDGQWEQKVRELATRANSVMIRAAAAYTDISNQEEGVTQDKLFSNYTSADKYATMVPPAVRIQVISSLGKVGEMCPTAIAGHMVNGFEKYGRVYSLEGWQGMAEDFGEEHTLSEFQDFLINEKLLLKKVDLGGNAEIKLKTFIEAETGEAKLGGYFSGVSVFSLF